MIYLILTENTVPVKFWKKSAIEILFEQIIEYPKGYALWNLKM